MVSRILKDHLSVVYGGEVDTSLYSAHSLRAGFVTEASNHRIDARTIAQTTRHQSLAMIRTYDRPENRFDTHRPLTGGVVVNLRRDRRSLVFDMDTWPSR